MNSFFRSSLSLYTPLKIENLTPNPKATRNQRAPLSILLYPEQVVGFQPGVVPLAGVNYGVHDALRQVRVVILRGNGVLYASAPMIDAPWRKA